MNPKRLLPCLVAILLASSPTYADTIARWTFETSQPGVNTLPASPGAGNWLTNIVAETPTGTAAGWHAGATTYSSPGGNGSSHSFSSQTWAVGDFYQFAVSSIGFQNLAVSFDITKSATGPGTFAVQYSTDGSSFTQFGSTFLVLTNGTGAPTWTSSTVQSAYTISIDLSSVTALNNAPIVYFRLVDAAAPSGSGGTLRVDNFLVSGTTLSGPPSITTQPQAKIVYWGDTVYLDVTASGSAPLSYQWYYPNLNSPVSNGSSGYGAGTIGGSTTNSLVLTYIDPSQAGDYRVIITNSLGAVTSQIAHLTVNVRTPIVTNIAYLRTLQNYTTWLPVDTTNIYSVTGVVTTPFNISGSGNSSEFFIQDDTAGICVFVGGGSYLPNPGDRVQVAGPLGQYLGLLEFNLSASNPSHSVSNPINTGNALPKPVLLDFSSLGNIPYMESIEGSLILVSNVYPQQSSLQFAPGNINLTNLYSKVMSLYVGANAQDVIGQNVPKFAASIQGVLSQYATSVPATNGYELDILQYADLTAGTPPPPILTMRKVGANCIMTWLDSSYALQSAPGLGGTFTTIGGATSPYTNVVYGSATFYRLAK